MNVHSFQGDLNINSTSAKRKPPPIRDPVFTDPHIDSEFARFTSAPVYLLKPIHWLGHPDNHSLSLSNVIYIYDHSIVKTYDFVLKTKSLIARQRRARTCVQTLQVLGKIILRSFYPSASLRVTRIQAFWGKVNDSDASRCTQLCKSRPNQWCCVRN